LLYAGRMLGWLKFQFSIWDVRSCWRWLKSRWRWFQFSIWDARPFGGAAEAVQDRAASFNSLFEIPQTSQSWYKPCNLRFNSLFEMQLLVQTIQSYANQLHIVSILYLRCCKPVSCYRDCRMTEEVSILYLRCGAVGR